MIAKYDQMLNNRQHFVCVDPYVNSDNIILNNISCHFWGYNRFYLQYCCYVLLSGRREQGILLFIISILSSDSLPPFTSHSKYCKNPGKICKNLCKNEQRPLRHAPTNVRITNTQKPPVHCTVAGCRGTVVTIFTIFCRGYLLGGD